MGALGAPESLLPLKPIFELLAQFVFEHALHKVPIFMSKLHFKKNLAWYTGGILRYGQFLVVRFIITYV